MPRLTKPGSRPSHDEPIRPSTASPLWWSGLLGQVEHASPRGSSPRARSGLTGALYLSDDSLGLSTEDS